jgi:uncharacterized protein (DUF2147 family)
MTPTLPTAALVLFLAAAPALAAGPAADPIVGQWVQEDDETHAPDAVIEIREAAGLYSGTIVKLYPAPDRPAAPRCTACGGALKDRPIVGLTIIEGVRRAGTNFDGGSILDPETGKSYSVVLKPAADGRTLAVTGYVGLPAFGETRVWTRLP